MQERVKTLVERIEALARISQLAHGVLRPSLTPEMKQVNTLVAEWMRAAGMTTHEDNMGSLIGRYAGATPDAKTLMIGSHLDTVIDAGKYDGVLGVLLGLAVVEYLHQTDTRLPFAIEVVAFCDEEGLRFHLPFLGSKTIAGVITADELRRVDGDGVSIAEAIRLYGGDPQALPQDAYPRDRLIGYLEAHIEQGPLLENLKLPVGIVTAIAGIYRAQVVFTGEAGHAGTVPMTLRRDALVAGAQFVLATQQCGLATPDLVATVGQLEVLPGASNAVPGKVTLTLDLRHQDAAVRASAYAQLRRDAERIARECRCSLSWDLVMKNESVPCAPALIEMLEAAVRAQGIEPFLLASGAGHDAVQLAHVTDVAMLFVPCKAGISHNPAEYCAPSDILVALQTLLHTVTILADSTRK